MKKIFITLIISLIGINAFSQLTTTCATGTIKLKTQNHQYGTLEWQKSHDGVNWENIHNAHDTTYVFTTTKASYYRAINKFPYCDPIISSETLVQRPPIANAGEDRLINDTFMFLAGNTAIGSTGIWSIVEGTGGTILEPTNPNSKFTGTTGNYKLLWTLQNTCGTSNDTINVNFINNQYHNKIVIVDDTDVIQSTPSQIQNGNYIIEFSNPVPTIDNETVLVGTVGNGFLRKVNTVSQTGNTFTMTTTQGKLNDLFVDGGFELGNVFEIDSILPASRMAHMKRLNLKPTRAQILSDPKFRNGVHYYVVRDEVTSPYNGIEMHRSNFVNNQFSTNTNFINPTFNFTFNNTLVNQNGINVKLEGGLNFTPNVYADYKKTLFNRKFNIGINNSTLVSNYKFTVTSNMQSNVSNHTFNLFNYDRLVELIIGGVPVFINVNIQFDGKATANVNSNLSFVHEYTNTLTTNAGIKYENGEWSSHYSDSIDNDFNTDLNISGGLTQSFEIGPKITFKLYDVVGPYVDAKLTEDLDLCYSLVNTGAVNWKANLDIGGKITLGVLAEVMDYDIFDYSKTWEDRELYNVNFPYQIEYHSGNFQTFTNDIQLSQPVKVRVMSNKGFPVPGVTVFFECLTGNGFVQNSYVVTDLDGYASTLWTPHSNNGTSKLKAIVQDCNQHNISNSPLVFEATEQQAFDCTQTTLFGSYTINNNILTPIPYLGLPPYTYSTNDGLTFSSTVPQIILSDGNDYFVIIKDANGCMAHVSYFDAVTTCANKGLKLQVTNYGTNTVASAQGGTPPYLYALNGSTNYTTNNTFINLSTGTNTITVKDINSCIKTTSINVSDSVSNLTAYFEVNPSSLVENSPIEFTNLSTNAVTYLWNFGGVQTSTLANPTHIYNGVGNVTITLTAFNGSQQNTFSRMVTIGTNNNILNIPTAFIPGGTFTMGSPITEPNRDNDEVEHLVTLSSFKMSKYEITCLQFAEFLNAVGVGSNGKWVNGPYPTFGLLASSSTYGLVYSNGQWTINSFAKRNAPIAQVSWYGAASFAFYVGGRLPTESEWEFACRGTTNSTYYSGSCLNKEYSNYWWAFPQTGCISSTGSPLTTQRIGLYIPNNYGLYDMHGNVSEWCSDWYSTYPTANTVNPIGGSTGTTKVRRGGGYNSYAWLCRSSYRSKIEPLSPQDNMGFRVVFNP